MPMKISILFPLQIAIEKGSWRVNSVPAAGNLLLQMITQGTPADWVLYFFLLSLCKYTRGTRSASISALLICRQDDGVMASHSPLCQCVVTFLPRGHLSGDSTSVPVVFQSYGGSWLHASQTLPEWWFRNWTDTAKLLCIDHLLRTATR